VAGDNKHTVLHSSVPAKQVANKPTKHLLKKHAAWRYNSCLQAKTKVHSNSADNYASGSYV